MKKLLMLTFAVVVLLALVFSGCASSKTAGPSAVPAAPTQEMLQRSYGLGRSGSSAPVPAPAPVINVPGAPPMTTVTTSDGEETSQTWAGERMIVRTGNINLVIEDVPSAIDRIAKLADGFGGYV